ncbi:protein kinase [Myxococcus sp. AM009]|uniref:serine/threonine-protein kinase n=1 Tax=unclassified Myxococcus TaxID=2648731 RepID=UPI001595FA38|nr:MULTISPECIES: serine/threonine-protein kinase [unclassified Myxococcus]NVI97428.1 protein kinase [Myxococcus sp. AM009]NVJ15138.1 protein kinase [Myxococcus sp. AM010]
MASAPRERFGRYELQERVGHGGMAETWRARLRGAAGVTKSVLIKKVLPEYANDEAFVSMFISEARISATLSHGAIAQVFDFGKVDGQYFLAMELVEGQPLNRIMKRALRSGFHSLPVPIAVFIAMEMCRGLHYAHTRGDEKGEPLGIVHRDISPDNVLIGYEGEVKIVDFGIAKARSLRSFNTEPGVVKGKYLFFSPEQARGEAVDARTDVWATGVVLFQMLCGRLPLEGQVHTVLQRLNSGQPLPSARQVRSDIPVALDAILQRALALRKDSRFASAHALGDALAGFLYSSTPRFSPMSVAYLLRELFRPDLEALGVDARVPAAFAEELSIWREAPPLPAPTQHGVPALDLAPDSRTEERGPVEVDDAAREAPAPRVTRVGLFAEGSRSSQWVARVGLVVAAVLAAVAVTRVGSDLLAAAREEARVPGPPVAQRIIPPVAAATRPVAAAAPSRASAAVVESADDEEVSENADTPEAAAGRSGVARPVSGARSGKVVPATGSGARGPTRQAQATRLGEAGNALAASQVTAGPAYRVLIAGRTLQREGKFTAARSSARECVRLEPDNAECYLLLGAVEVKLGRVEEGARNYHRFLELAPSDHPLASTVLRTLQEYEARQPGRP